MRNSQDKAICSKDMKEELRLPRWMLILEQLIEEVKREEEQRKKKTTEKDMLLTYEFIRKIVELMKLKYRKSREAYKKEKESQGFKVIWVHQLCECSLRESMREKFPEIYDSSELNPRFIVGELIHLALKNFFPSEDKVFEKVLQIGDTSFIVAGTPDLLTDDKFIEVKYMTTYHELPLPHHIMQAKLYKWLTGKDGEIMYITPDGIKGYPVRDAYTDEEIKKIITEPKSPMWVDWECSLCAYRSYCPKEIRKK